MGFAAAEPENALRLILAPDQLRPAVANWPEVTRAVMMRLERQTRMAPGDEALEALRGEMLAYPGVREVVRETWSPEEEGAILVPLQFELGHQRLSWFTTIAGFGGAVDVTTQEVVIESLVPADEATRRFAEESREAASRDL